ncbi:hypothetical protein [Thiolapillus sp.]|uniref:hypothetical protein n=2 Tax=Thiolapillus sp. TaxID=2017437 RepID=UPI003AF93456
MRILKITTHWTTEEADCMFQFLDDFKEARWQCHGEDIVQMYKTTPDEQRAGNEERTFDDESPF